MKILSSLEIKAVVEELQVLAEGKVDQIYQPDNTEIILSIHKTGVGRKQVRIIPGVALYITTKRRPSPQEQLNFNRFLRKRLGNARLKAIIQKNLERIVEFHFETKDAQYILIAEFFSKGNIILCDKDYTILSALQVQLWKDRKVRAKETYAYPPAKELPQTFVDFQSFLKESTKESIVKTLASGLNLGGSYAEEICARAHIDKNTKTVTDNEQKKLFDELQKIYNENPSPNSVNGIPFPFRMTSQGQGTQTATFNEALDQYYGQFMTEIEEKEIQAQKMTKKDKYAVILEEQEKQFKEFEHSIEENKKKGDWIYEHYMDIKEDIELFKKRQHDELKKRKIRIEGTQLIIEAS